MRSPKRIHSWSTAFHYLLKGLPTLKSRKAKLYFFADDIVVSNKGGTETAGKKNTMLH